jgi:hypothetical protein
LGSSCYFILNLCFTSKSGTNTVQRRMFTFAYFLRKCFVLTGRNSSLKKITYFIVELLCCTVFFCNLIRNFCLFRPPKTTAEHCLRAVKNQMLECVHKYEIHTANQNHWVSFFFNLTINKLIKRLKEVKLNFRVKIDKVIFHESSIIIELELLKLYFFVVGGCALYLNAPPSTDPKKKLMQSVIRFTVNLLWSWHYWQSFFV